LRHHTDLFVYTRRVARVVNDDELAYLDQLARLGTL
jgi:hypothetical protein